MLNICTLYFGAKRALSSAIQRIRPYPFLIKKWNSPGLRGPGFKQVMAVILILLLSFLSKASDALPQSDPIQSGNLSRKSFPRSLTQYVHKSWSFNTGLPGNEIHALVQTIDRSLWLGTDSGLVRFDGLDFTVFDPANTPAMTNANVRALTAAADGSLWIATEDGLLRLKDRVFTRYTEKDGLGGNNIAALSIDANGALWAYTSAPNDWRYRWSNGKFVIEPRATNSLSSQSKQCFGQTMLQDHNGDIWKIEFTSKFRFNGLSVLRDGKQTTYKTADGLSSNAVKLLFEDEHGAVWIKTDKGVDRYINGKFLHYHLHSHDPQPDVTCLKEDAHGNVLFVTRTEGVFRWSPQSVSQETLSGEISDGMFEDRDGNFWIVTSKGLDLLQEGFFTPYGRTEGMDAPPLSLMAARDGNIWVGTLTGKLYRLSSEKITEYRGLTTAPPADPRTGQSFIGRAILSIYQTSDEQIYISSVAGLKVLRGNELVELTNAAESISEKVETMYEDSEHTFWIGTDHGLVRLKNGEYTRYLTSPGAAINSVSVITGSADGGLWIGTSGGGLRHFKNGEFQDYTTANGLSHNVITALLEDSNGTLWIGTPRGLNLLKYGSITKWHSAKDYHALESHICAILRDDENRLWISSKEGILSFGGPAGKSNSWYYARYGAEDGIRSKSCSEGTQATGVKDRFGNLWFATNAGIVRVDPERISRESTPLQVFMESVSADFLSIDPVHGGSVPPGKNDLEFHYTAPSFRDPDKIQFRYRLVNLERNWVAAGTRRSAFYTNLAPGKYLFQVQVRNINGVWNESGASVEIYLRPRFYQMLWVRLFFLLILCLSGAGLYLMRRRQLTAQMQRRLEERLIERTRIAQELHDTFLQDIVGLVFNIELASNELPSRPGEAKGRLQGVLDQLRQTVAAGRRALTDLRSPNISYGELSGALLHLGEQLQTDSGPRLNIHIEGNDSWLPSLIGDEVFQIGREALFNAIRHAQATTIEVALSCKERGLTLRVADDGCGIEPEILRRGRTGHFGLQGMRERAERIRAQFTCRSQQGHGTEISIHVPLPVSAARRRPAWFIPSTWNWLLKYINRS
jgi:ligand-binding sensor domain-containing protein/signal transduction histidine kinase